MPKKNSKNPTRRFCSFVYENANGRLPERSERDGLRGTTQGGDVYQLK